MNQQPLSNAKNLLLIALAIDAVLNALIGFHDYGLLTQLREIKAGTRYYTPEFATALTEWENAGYFSILSLIVVAAALVHWLRSCYAHAENEIGCTDLEQKKYVIWGWLPILNIFKPYQVLNELFRVGGSSYSSSNGYKKEGGSSSLLLWWIFWVISHLILSILNRAYINAGTKIIFNESHTEASVLLKSAIAAYDYSVWIAAISTIVSIGWLWASNLLTERLLERQPIGIADEFQPTTPNNRTVPAAATPVIARAHPTAQPTTNTEEIWAKALHEFDHGQRRLGLWSRVFAEADGDEGKAKASYLKNRVAEMLSERRALSPFSNASLQPPAKAEPTHLIRPAIIKNPTITQNINNRGKNKPSQKRGFSKTFYSIITALFGIFAISNLYSMLASFTLLFSGKDVLFFFLIVAAMEAIWVLLTYHFFKKSKLAKH